MWNHSLIGILIVSVVIFGCGNYVSGISRPPTMVLENNQYKNVVVAIHQSIGEDSALVDQLKVNISFFIIHVLF